MSRLFARSPLDDIEPNWNDNDRQRISKMAACERSMDHPSPLEHSQQYGGTY